jgi:probable blue pigment (indigoidine) exporter
VRLAGPRLQVVAVTALAPALWGTTYITTKEFFLPHRPLLSALLRTFPFGVTMVLAIGRPPAGAWGWRTAVLGVINVAIFPAFLLIAAYRVPGALVATIVASQPLLVVVLALVFLRERPRLLTLGAAVVAFAGVALLVSGSRIVLDGFGVVAAIVAAFAMATGIVLQKAWGPPPPILRFTAWQLVYGGVVLLPVTLALEGLPGSMGLDSAVAYAYQAVVVTAFGYALWFRGIGRLAPVEVGLLGLMSPLVATILGWVFLDEALGPVQITGAALVVGSLLAPQLAPQPSADGFRRDRRGEIRMRFFHEAPALREDDADDQARAGCK